MFSGMFNALAPGFALCCAALLGELAARQARLPTRWVWLVAMAASVMLPVLGPTLLEMAPVRLPLPPLPAALRVSATPAAPHELESLARCLWLLSSIVTLALLGGAAALLHRRARSWRRATLEGIEVYVAQQSGPAVFGWFRPRIVLPAWLASAPSRQRELAMAHEQSHLAARDPQWLAVAFAMLAIMPWNVALWWQLRRLRGAIEVDCDRRVLSGDGDLLAYGNTLIELSRHRASQYGLMAASVQPQSLLERRIRIMSSQPHRWSRVAAVLLAGMAAGVVAVAAELTPPAAATMASTPIEPIEPIEPVAPVEPVEPVAPIAAAAPSRWQAADSENIHEAKLEAEQAAERAIEAKQDAEAAEAAAQEAMRDAKEQRSQADAAKREAEAAQAEADARKLEAELAAQAR